MRDCDRCGKKIQYGALCERCNGYLEGLRETRKREADICREFAERLKIKMRSPENGFCDAETICNIVLAEIEEEE